MASGWADKGHLLGVARSMQFGQVANDTYVLYRVGNWIYRRKVAPKHQPAAKREKKSTFFAPNS